MITRCTARRACVRHLARGVSGPSDGDPCGALTPENVTAYIEAAHDVLEAGTSSKDERRLARVVVALAEQLAETSATSERQRARLEEAERLDPDGAEARAILRRMNDIQ